MDNSKLIEALNDLLEKTYDAEKGYIESRENTNSSTLKVLFNQKVAQRYHFGHEIKDLIRDLGGKPEKGGSVEGFLHRTWLDFKSMMSMSNDEEILEEIQKGEEAALEEYNEFLKEHDMPKNVRSVISKQRDQIARAHDRAEILEEVYED